MMKFSPFDSPQEVDELTLDIDATSGPQLVVWNDDVNTFDHVIESLVTICDQTPEQAEQCALFIHFKGKYAVKKGEYKRLKPMAEALGDRGIQATIEG